MRIMRLALVGLAVAVASLPADQKTTGDKNKQNDARPFVGGPSPYPIPGGITQGNCTQMQAQSNRTIMEAQTSAFCLPSGVTIKLDKAINFVSNQFLDGQNAILVNGFDSGTRTIEERGGGLGYLDYLTVTGPNEVTLADRDQALNYKAGQPAYFFLVDGFQGPTASQLRTLHGIAYSDATKGKIKLYGPPLDNRLTGGKWFYNAAVVYDVPKGTTQLQVPPGRFHKGDNMQLTEGTTLANEGREEWHTILRFNGPNAVLDTPVQRDYSAAVLAQATPITGVTLQNITIHPSASPNGTAQINYALNWNLNSVTVTDGWFLAGCANHVYKSCTFDSVLITACHDMTFIDCTFNICRLEEGCFNCNFQHCTFTNSIGSNVGCEWLTLTQCTLTGTDSFIGLNAPGSVLEGLTCAAGTGGVFLQGNNWTVLNITSASGVSAQVGNNFYLAKVTAPSISLGQINGAASGGRVIASPNTTVYSGVWRITP